MMAAYQQTLPLVERCPMLDWPSKSSRKDGPHDAFSMFRPQPVWGHNSDSH